MGIKVLVKIFVPVIHTAVTFVETYIGIDAPSCTGRPKILGVEPRIGVEEEPLFGKGIYGTISNSMVSLSSTLYTGYGICVW
ncbi:Putative protein [Zobellia galactanivorans]|uniref:Uncharacterized protein n=1 Tax=Zobellia galactanivorans (strain DSM 12802 / CCUG 47099 / CIP 106680 / NCIMB 13871 / Dsij) TaxID=63186 RepID=G0L787_ZOBGA|nr:Putative protein [Zobellia galactanivorans]